MKVHPKQAGITAKRLSNIKSDLGLALRITRTAPRQRSSADRTDAWLSFLNSASVKHQKHQLSRFVDFCCSHGLEPDQVNDNVMSAFEAHLDARILTKNPKEIRKDASYAWNAIIKQNNLSFTPLVVPKADRYIAAPLNQYPVSLQADLAKYLERLRHADIMDEEGPDRALSETSLRNVEAHVRQFLDAACSNGFDRTDFENLSDALRPDVMKAAVTKIQERQGGQLTATTRNILATLQAIAKYHVKAPNETVNLIRKAKSKIGDVQIGMTDKNMERLAQFDDPRNIARLVTLPNDLMQWAQENSTQKHAPLRAMHAVAISILLVCPLRIKNISMLDIERHLRAQRGGKHKIYALHIPASEMKNRNPMDFALGEQPSRHLETYLSNFRQHVSNDPGTALFPKKSGGGPRTPDNLGHEISRLIRRETGLVMNAHLFRHFNGMMYLNYYPGEFETVRQFLGHKKLDTTMTFYARFSSKAAIARYDQAVLSKWQGGQDD